MEHNRCHRHRGNAQNLPGEVLEQVLARVPFRERLRAAAVCRAWSQHLSQCGLPLWQAACIPNNNDRGCRSTDRSPGSRLAQQLHALRPLQLWLCHHGRGLLQLQCSLSLTDKGWPDWPEDSLLLTIVAAAAPSLQTLRLDAFAVGELGSNSLERIARMGGSLRQLALIGLQRATDYGLVACLAQLPLLQDLAVIFDDDSNARYKVTTMAQLHGSQPKTEMFDMMDLLNGIAVSGPALQTLALGQTPTSNMQRKPRVALSAKPLPASLSRLTALSSVTLHNVGWSYSPDALPHLPQLRRLCLRTNFRITSEAAALEVHGRFSTFTGLEALQAVLPDPPRRLPLGLTQLVLAPLHASHPESTDYAAYVCHTIRDCIPLLRGLRHLAFHGLKDVSERFVDEVCTAAGALPQLISLHLVQGLCYRLSAYQVKCKTYAMPAEMCGLSQLQLLNLAHNRALQLYGYKQLGTVPLHKLASCRRLDLRCLAAFRYSLLLLDLDTIRAIAGMPALQQLALPLLGDAMPEPARLEEVQAQLAQCRGPGMPPIQVVAEMPLSDEWAAVDVRMPFGAVNNVLGQQLDRTVVSGVQIDD